MKAEKCPKNYFQEILWGKRNFKLWISREKSITYVSKKCLFKAPSTEWIEDRLSRFNELLELSTGESALALRKLLGPMKLEAQYPDIGKPYYVAHSSINALAITEPLPNENILDNGSNSFQWWAHLGLNQGPLACQASALPLSYAPEFLPFTVIDRLQIRTDSILKIRI